MKMRSVFSSHIDAIGWHPHTKELHVRFGGTSGKPGKYTIYEDVPEDIASAVLGSASIGQALHEHIRGKYNHRYEEDD